jgi:Tripartite tricarboxylate transporter family receptor
MQRLRVRAVTKVSLAAMALSWLAWSYPALAQAPRATSWTLSVEAVAPSPLHTFATVLAAEMGRQTGQPLEVAIKHMYQTLAPEASESGGLYLGDTTLFWATTRRLPQSVGLVAAAPMVLLGRAALPALDAGDFIQWLRREGSKVRIGYSGEFGSASLQCALQLEQLTGIKMTKVVGADKPALKMLLAETADVVCDDAPSAIPEVLAGTVRAFAVASDERLPSLWDVPSADEAGLPMFAATAAFGLYAPAVTSNEEVMRLNAALQKALANEALIAKFSDLGLSPFPMTHRSPDAQKAFTASASERAAGALQALGVMPPPVEPK